MVNQAPHLPPEATDKAWTLVEELTFARQVPGQRQSLASVARKIGVSHPTLRGWEEGEWLPGLAAFIAWAEAMDYDVALISREPE
jgi:transcriptional regulator with XRE-family HTH domain